MGDSSAKINMTKESILEDENPLEIVNIVGSGDIGREVDVEQVSIDADVYQANYKEGSSSVLLRFSDESGLIILYRSGKYIIRGGKDYEKLHRTKNDFFDLLRRLGLIEGSSSPTFKINNIVFVGDLGQSVNLEALVIQLGLENAEFEPEQFPGIVYRPPEFDCVLLIFGSGKMSITGSNDEDEAVDAYRAVESEVEAIHN